MSHIRGINIAVITDEYDKLKAIEKVIELCGNSFDAIFAGSDWKGDPKEVDKWRKSLENKRKK